MGPLVHGHAGQLVGELVSVGDFGISGVSRGLYPGLSLTGDRHHRAHHLMFVLSRSSRSCSGFDLSLRSGQSVPDRRVPNCHWDCLGDFLPVRGKHLCRNLPSRCQMCQDLLVHLERFVGVPPSWVGSLLLCLIRRWE